MLSDQSENYTAYEHALNIFRTAEKDAILFMNGDNYVFPVTYGRLVERMREEVSLYDRHNILFKMPGASRGIEARSVPWERKRNETEKQIIEGSPDKAVYYAVFGPYAVELPSSQEMIPVGVSTGCFRGRVTAVRKFFVRSGSIILRKASTANLKEIS